MVRSRYPFAMAYNGLETISSAYLGGNGSYVLGDYSVCSGFHHELARSYGLPFLPRLVQFLVKWWNADRCSGIAEAGFGPGVALYFSYVCVIRISFLNIRVD